jgi:hypothetical protein
VIQKSGDMDLCDAFARRSYHPRTSRSGVSDENSPIKIVDRPYLALVMPIGLESRR